MTTSAEENQDPTSTEAPNEVDLLDFFLQGGTIHDGNETSEDNDLEHRAKSRRKERFFREIIKLVLVDPPNNWKVERFRLSPELLQKLIDRALQQHQQEQCHQEGVVGVSIAYLKLLRGVQESGRRIGSSNGSKIILPADAQRRCNQDDTYEIVLLYPSKTLDHVQDESYFGQMHFILRNVPPSSHNHLHPVKAHHIKHWIRGNLLREDPVLMQYESQIAKAKLDLAIVRKRFDNISQEMFFDKKGVVLKGVTAEKKRKELYDELRETMKNVQDKIHDMEKEKYQTYIKKCDEIVLSVGQSDDHTWSVQLGEGDNKQYYEKLFLMNSNWNATLMYAFPTHEVTTEKPQLDSDFLIDVSNVRVERVEHGFGCYHHREAVVESKFETVGTVYHGTYDNGSRHGYGIMYSRNFIYGGSFSRGMQSGSGTMIEKDGDVIKSTFGVEPKRDNDYLTHNRYATGLANGHSTISFSDGAFYEGDMQNGIIHGQGVYISAKG
jgi:hypothetical protein